jgi:hypothetical protein
MTVALAVMASAVVVVGLILLEIAVRSVKLVAPPTLRSGSVVPDPTAVADGLPTPGPTRAPPPRQPLTR